MDAYQSIHGQDVASFDLPSTHRLPTVSAADALEELGTDPKRYLSTGLDHLDRALSSDAGDLSEDTPRPGGFQRGQVIEIWGPPGSGKTTFGLQLASDALKKGGKVVWVDGFRPVGGPRLRQVLELSEDASTLEDESDDGKAPSSNFTHFVCPSLAHFTALLCRPTASCVPKGTSLVVVDSFSTLMSQAFPKTQDSHPRPAINTLARRPEILQSTITSLQKLAATRDVTVVVLSHCATLMQSGRGATLIPALNVGMWDQGFAVRLGLFRDWSFQNEHVSGVRFVGLQRLNGKAFEGGIGPAFAFDICDDGLIPVTHDERQALAMLSSTPRPKRKFDAAGFEIAIGEEDYGWDHEDATQLPPNPSQWQGSEDLIIGLHDEDGNRKDEGYEEYEDEEEPVHDEESRLYHDSLHDEDDTNEQTD